jgi:hypothetical protein
MKNTAPLSELAHPLTTRGWRIESYVRAIAGSLVLLSVALSVSVNHWWILLAVFVGLNLIQSMFTGWCLMSNLLSLVLPGSRAE